MKKSKTEEFDVIIIGGGAAGMSAALWCDDLKLKALLLESNSKLGGQLHIVHNPIENHLGVKSKDGAALLKVFLSQVKTRKFELRQNTEIDKVNLKTKTVYLKDGSEFSAKAIVIATGVRRRKLGVEGEDDFQGNGILESGKRDVDKIKNKTVCIVGGGDAALENAQILSATAAKIYLICRSKEFRGRDEFIKAAKTNKKVEILMETDVLKICGDKKVESVLLKTSAKDETFTLSTDAILLRIGVMPNTEIFQKKLNLNSTGYIEIDANCETNVKNIFAIGDVANPISPTISTAVGNGATSIKTIIKNLYK